MAKTTATRPKRQAKGTPPRSSDPVKDLLRQSRGKTMGKPRSPTSKTDLLASARGANSPPKVLRRSGSPSSPSYASAINGLKMAPSVKQGADSASSSLTSVASSLQKSARTTRNQPNNPYASPSDASPTVRPKVGSASSAKYPPTATDPPSPNKTSTGTKLPGSVADPMDVDGSQKATPVTRKTRFTVRFAHKVNPKKAQSGDLRTNSSMVKRWWNDLKKVDPTAVLLPWKSKSSGATVSDYNELDNIALEQPFLYFQRSSLMGARINGYVSLWIDVHLQHSVSVAKLEAPKSKSQSGHKVTMWRRIAQTDERIKFVGFLPYADRRVDFKRMAAILADKIEIPLDIRWKELTIQPGMEETKYEVPTSTVRGLCVGAPISKHAAVPDKLFKLLSSGFKPLGLDIMYCNYPSKHPRVARMTSYDKHLAGHALWCRKLKTTAVDGITGLHEPLTAQGPSLNDLLLKRLVQWEGRKIGSPLLVSVSTAWYAEDAVLFSYLDTHEDEAEAFITGSTVCRWLMEMFPQFAEQIKRHVSSELVAQAATLIWDPNLEESLPADVAMDAALLDDKFDQDLSPIRGSQKPTAAARKSDKSTSASRHSRRSDRSRGSNRSKFSKTSKRQHGKVPRVVQIDKSTTSNMSVDTDARSGRSSLRSVTSSVILQMQEMQQLQAERDIERDRKNLERDQELERKDQERDRKDQERDKKDREREAERDRKDREREKERAEREQNFIAQISQVINGKSSPAQGAAGPVL